MSFFAENFYVPILLPLWIFVLIITARFSNIRMSRRVVSVLSIVSTFTGTIFALCSLRYLSTVAQTPDSVCIDFINIKHYILELGYFISYPNLLLTIFVSIVCILTQIYSAISLKNNKSYPRAFGYLNLIYFSLLGFILSPNFFQTLIFALLTSVSLYLIVGFWYKNEEASKVSANVLCISLAADIVLSIGYFLLSCLVCDYTSSDALISLPIENIQDIGNYFYSSTNEVTFFLVSTIIFLGFALKILILPICAWLSDTNDKPIPILSLIYCALVSLNIIYSIRLYFDIFSQSHLLVTFILIMTCLLAIPVFYFSFVKNSEYLDLIIYFLKNKVFKRICNIADFLDKYIIDGIVSLNMYIARSFSWTFSKMQTGNVQRYVMYGIVLITLTFISLILAYSLILQYNLYGG